MLFGNVADTTSAGIERYYTIYGNLTQGTTGRMNSICNVSGSDNTCTRNIAGVRQPLASSASRLGNNIKRDHNSPQLPVRRHTRC
ncbi:hypothetical protein CTI12_AA272310 [Artemisia annua]|uniref:Uncharacterized protein n=1 Tax=Artemisia annua TaxID=35608 RepID=A0A2U1NF56_ARTAN|nr:hypothetical protein CTI12_AA272310 [Artemisia annua]